MFELTPFFYVLMALYFMIVMAMAWMVLDSSRGVRAAQVEAIERLSGSRRESLTFYQLFGGIVIVLYLIQRVLAFIPNINASLYTGVRHLSFIFTLLGLFVLLTYLLRVIYPKPVPEPDEDDPHPAAIASERDRDFRGGHPPAEGSTGADEAAAIIENTRDESESSIEEYRA